jgi:4-amino-4-deoxy-L-arabinose transferase-like glycosyltransferase
MEIDEKIVFVSILVVNLVILIFRPFELDESLYILIGKMILNQKLNPFSSDYLSPNYSNPFNYIFGSPLVSIIYGFFYLLGGLILSRIVSLIFVFSTLIVTYKLTEMLFDKKTAIISLIIAGFSNTTILIATNSLLDSVGVFFFLLALYLLYKKKPFYSGLSFGLAILSKFIVVLPVLVLIPYLYKKGFKLQRILIGLAILIVPFIVYDFDVLISLYSFFTSKHISPDLSTNLMLLINRFIHIVPLPFLLYLLDMKKKFIKNNYLLIIPFLSILLFHFLTLNYISIYHTMTYGMIPLSVLSGKTIVNMGKKIQFFILFLFVILNVKLIIDSVYAMPYYDTIVDDIPELDGIILADNPYIVHLIRDTDLTDDYVYNFFYFDFNHDWKSTKEDYEEAMKNNFFDYIIIPSKTTIESEYSELFEYVPKFYCVYKRPTDQRLSMAIYSKCT